MIMGGARVSHMSRKPPAPHEVPCGPKTKNQKHKNQKPKAKSQKPKTDPMRASIIYRPTVAASKVASIPPRWG